MVTQIGSSSVYGNPEKNQSEIDSSISQMKNLKKSFVNCGAS
jgi:hypothetical protein